MDIDFAEEHYKVLACGMTEEEAKAWIAVAKAAQSILHLPTLHVSDHQESAQAIHVLQEKLLARVAYRKYLEQSSTGNVLEEIDNAI